MNRSERPIMRLSYQFLLAVIATASAIRILDGLDGFLTDYESTLGKKI